MKTLLTGKEHFANCKNVYNEDFTAFTTEGEPRGKMKQISTEWMNETDYVLLNGAFKLLGLDKYIEIELDSNTLYMRIIEDDAADKALAKKVINGINELTKETALKLDLMLLELEESLGQNESIEIDEKPEVM